jgi:hypothetical protein
MSTILHLNVRLRSPHAPQGDRVEPQEIYFEFPESDPASVLSYAATVKTLDLSDPRFRITHGEFRAQPSKND